MTLDSTVARHARILAALSLAAAAVAAGPAYPQSAGDSLPAPRRVEADAALGFASPYFLYVPPNLPADSLPERPRTILVLPNNTAMLDDDPAVHQRVAEQTIGHYRRAAARLGVPVLMPAFPRPASLHNLYTHALDRDALLTDTPGLRRLDLQLLAMIDDARRTLEAEGIRTERRVLMHGHSAAGMFVNRFVMLHPERVKAATIGAPGGWPIAPMPAHRGRSLGYPAGVSDLEMLTGRAFDPEAAREVPLFLFLGAQDTNDSVPFDDSYDPEERAAVLELFGATPAERWTAAEALYREVLPRAVFRTYPEVGHEITREMWSEILAFLGSHTAR